MKELTYLDLIALKTQLTKTRKEVRKMRQALDAAGISAETLELTNLGSVIDRIGEDLIRNRKCPCAFTCARALGVVLEMENNNE